MTGEAVSTFTVISVILLPILLGVIAAMWWRMEKQRDEHEAQKQIEAAKRDEIWKRIDADAKERHNFELEAQRSFVRAASLQDLRSDFDRRLERIEQKLDRALAGKPVGAD